MRTLLIRLLLVVAVALVPALAFHAYTDSQARNVRQKLIEDEALRLLLLVNNEQQRIIDSAEQVLDVFGGAPAVVDRIPDLCQRLTASILARAPRYMNVAVIGLDGRITCAPNLQSIGIDLADRAYFKDALRTGRVVVGQYTVGRSTGKPGIPVAKAFRDSTGAIAGVAEITLSLDWLGQQLEQVSLPPGANARIADRDGVILARHADTGLYAGKTILSENRFTLEGNQVAVRLVRGLDARMYVTAYAPPGDSPAGLAVAVGLDPETTFADLVQADRTGLILIIAGGASALLLTALLGNRLIRRPVAQLLDAAARWRSGALSVRTTLRKDNSEFGRLATAFDEMAEALEARERVARTALESTTDAVMVVDRDWRFTYLNRHARDITVGRELVGQPFWDRFSHLEASDFAEMCRTVMATGQPARIELVGRRTGRYFEINAYPSEEGLTLYVRDVTEARRVAAALRDTERRLELAGNAAGLGVWEWDIATGTSIWSDQEWRLHGLPPQPGGLSFDAWAATIHPDDRARVVAERRASERNPAQPCASEHRVVWPDGTVHWLLTRGAPIRDEAGEVVRIAGISMDVTALRQTQAALIESEARLRLATEGAGVGTWELDLLTGQGQWSAETVVLLAAGRPTFTLEDWVEVVHPDDRSRVVEAARGATEDGSSSYEVIYRALGPAPDGGERWILTRGHIERDAAGHPVRRAGVVLDVTERRRAEMALAELNQHLEERVREEVEAREDAQARTAQAERVQALGQLAGGIAHDFNNILQSISGAMTLIERRAGDETAVRRFANLSKEAIERGGSITRRLLTFGRRGDLKIEAFDLPALLRSLHEMLGPTLGASIEVKLRLASTLPPVMADRRQLETVLVNLATNARDAMTDGGQLILSADTEVVTPSSTPGAMGLRPGSYVRLAVIDTGAGMDAEILARAKEPFFTTKKLGAGTGLGLTMAQSFAEQSGGTIRLESRPGEGTMVTLWLPQAAVDDNGLSDAARAAALAQPQAQATSQRLLVVDDEAMIREIMTACLEDAGYGVLVAASGAEALTLLESHYPVHGMITDLSMPGMDGLALIRAVRARYPAMPSILLTGYAGDDAALALGRSMDGAVFLMRKPISDADLLDRISTMLTAGTGDQTRTASGAARE